MSTSIFSFNAESKLPLGFTGVLEATAVAIFAHTKNKTTGACANDGCLIEGGPLFLSVHAR